MLQEDGGYTCREKLEKKTMGKSSIPHPLFRSGDLDRCEKI